MRELELGLGLGLGLLEVEVEVEVVATLERGPWRRWYDGPGEE